jgi:electron transfer flavoprotein beta subunit
VKQVLETRVALEIDGTSGVIQKEPRPVYIINPADRSALEESIRLRDAAGGGTVTVVTIGPERTKSVLAHCLARGADRAIHVITGNSAKLDSFVVARVISEAIRKQDFDLVLCGNKTEDNGASEVGAVLAELLDISLVTNVIKIDISLKDESLKAVRKLERGNRQEVEADLPALVTVDTSICQPRYVTGRAKKHRARGLAKEVIQMSIGDLGLANDGSEVRCVIDVCLPKPRVKKIVRVAGASAADRMAMLVGFGGPAPKKPAQTAKVDGPESQADDIINFLKEKGLLL